MRHKITWRLICNFAVVLLSFSLLVGLLFSSLFQTRARAIYLEDLRAHAVSIADTISQFSQNYHAGICRGGGFKAYFRFIGDVARSEIWLVDAQNQPVELDEQMPTSSLESELPPGYAGLVQSVFASGDVMTLASDASSRMGDLVVGSPVHDAQGQVIYALLLRRPLNNLDQISRDVPRTLLMCLLFALALGVLLSILLSHRFIMPIHQMIHATRMMMAGQYDISTDITQQDELGTLARHIDALSARLLAANRAQQELDSMRTEFFSNVSHELRTPISVLKGSLEVLSEGLLTDPDEERAYCRQMLADANHMERLVNDLLELSRLKDSHFQIHLEPVNLIDILQETIRSMHPKMAVKRIAITLCGDTSPCSVLGDYGRLRQLFTILLDNAIKFSPEESDVTVSVSQAERCTVRVQDHGCGMAPEELAHIFDRFYRQHSLANCTGTGLGLPIAREIALRHRIELTCTSKPGEGTCFTLVFPMRQIGPSDPSQSGEQPLPRPQDA